MRAAEFERLYAEHAEPLLAFLIYRTGDRALAEDVLEDTFERALRRRSRFDRRRGSLKTWLYAIALNVLRDQARRSAAESRALDRASALVRASGGRDEFEQVEARDSVMAAMRVLSDEEREAVALRYGADLSIPEIAKVTRRPLTTAESRVYRALRRLRDELT